MTYPTNTLSSNSGLDLEAMLARFGTGVAPVNPSQLPVMEMPMLQNLQSAPMMNAPRSFMDGMLGGRNADNSQYAGWGGMAVGAASGLMNGYLGMQQLGVAKDSLAQSKKQFELNFGAQQKLTNSRLEDRQASRVAAGGSAYQSVGDYMKKNGV